MPATIWSSASRCRQVIAASIAAFVAEHHVERPFVKRRRGRAQPQAPAGRVDDGERRMSRAEGFLSRWSRRKRDAERDSPSEPSLGPNDAEAKPVDGGERHPR